MKKKCHIKKMNNRGSSMFLVMVGIIFVMLLASTVMAVAYANIVLKWTEKKANQAFYTAETAVDQVYSGLGDCALQSVSDAYVSQLGKIVEDSGSIVDNDAANKSMKKLFVEDYLKKLTKDATGTGAELTAANTYLADASVNADKLVLIKDFLNQTLTEKGVDTARMSVASVGSFTATANDPDYCLVIKDVVINYQSADEYYADITTDFMVKYPPLDVEFNNDPHPEFLEYSLIAENNVAFGNFNTNLSGTDNSTTVTVTANAGLYAGNNITINNGSILTLANAAKSVAHEAVNVKSGTSQSQLSVGAATLWSAGDLLLGQDKNSSAGAALSAGTDSVLYVQDDLEFNADDSSAVICGEYYGYGYYDGNADGRNASIIMNGRFGTLSVNARKLEILGRAYIDTTMNINGTEVNGYENGESINVKTNQSVYLVQDSYLKSNATNPVGIASSLVSADSNYNYQDLVDYSKLKDEFFAYSLLNPTTPVVLAKDSSKGLYYIYYNFSNADNKEKYVKAIRDGSLDGVSLTGNGSYQEQLKVLIRGIQKNFYDYATNSYRGSISVAATELNILGAYSSVMSASAGSTNIEINNGTLTSTEATNLSNKRIKELTGTYGLMAQDTVYGDIINENRATATGTTGFSMVYTDTATATDYQLIVTNTDSPEITYTHGIIVHNGTGTLTLSNDFTGLIISKGTIVLKGNATLNTDKTLMDTILKSTPEFAKFFKAYSPNNDGEVSIKDIAYGDIIFIQNWRKFED